MNRPACAQRLSDLPSLAGQLWTHQLADRRRGLPFGCEGACHCSGYADKFWIQLPGDFFSSFSFSSSSFSFSSFSFFFFFFFSSRIRVDEPFCSQPGGQA